MLSGMSESREPLVTNFSSEIQPEPLKPSNFHPAVEQMCGLAAELLMSGGHDDDVEGLLWALATHEYRRRFPTDTLNVDEPRTLALLKRNVAEWKRVLIRHWPEAPADVPAARAETIAERIRATTLQDARDRFEEFLAEANQEEIRLMRDIFVTRDGMGPDYDGSEVLIATAFSDELGQRTQYIRVDPEHWNLVRDYVRLLEGPQQRRSA